MFLAARASTTCFRAASSASSLTESCWRRDPEQQVLLDFLINVGHAAYVVSKLETLSATPLHQQDGSRAKEETSLRVKLAFKG